LEQLLNSETNKIVAIKVAAIIIIRLKYKL